MAIGSIQYSGPLGSQIPIFTAEGQAVGQAVSEKGQAVLEQKSKESSMFFDAGGKEKGRQYIYIYKYP